MTFLSGPVGVRNGLTQVDNQPVDQGKVIDLLWRIAPGDGGMKGVSSPPGKGSPRLCDPTLAAAIVNFQNVFVGRGEFRTADGVVDRGGRTLAKLDALASAAPRPAAPAFTDLSVLRFQQTMPGTPVSAGIPAITPASVIPFLFTPVPKDAALAEGAPSSTVSEFLFKIEKNGATFWVGALIPAGTVDFSRCYIFFHPDTISSTDDAAYPNFGGRWPTVQRYVGALGVQLGAVRPIPFIVPFMTNASHTNQPRTNLFADQGIETITDILTAIQISAGLAPSTGSVQRVGVASFSSGVNHLFRFGEKLGGSGLIREQIDLDSAFMTVAHKTAAVIPGAVNWMVTQSPPPYGRRIGWLFLSQHAFRNVNTSRGDLHVQIGFMMFQAMMTLSVVT